MQSSNKIFISFISPFLIALPFIQTTAIASDLLVAADNDNKLEEIRRKKVNKEGNLVVKFCKKLKDYKGFVEVSDKKFTVEEADIIKPRKIVWKNTNLNKQKGKSIKTDYLKARYFDDEDNSEVLKVVDEGECGVGILPFIILGAGIAAGAGGSSTSGSTSSN